VAKKRHSGNLDSSFFNDLIEEQDECASGHQLEENTGSEEVELFECAKMTSGDRI
jgi:hypothetical protein